jgi:hypothetical protein
MAWDTPDVLKARYNDLLVEQQEIVEDFHRARLAEDAAALGAAMDRHDLNATQQQSVINVWNTLQRQQQAPQPTASYEGLTREQARLAMKQGLSGEEALVAINATSDPRLDDADRMQMYAEGRTKYREWRAAGNKDEFDLQGKNYPGRR